MDNIEARLILQAVDEIAIVKRSAHVDIAHEVVSHADVEPRISVQR